MGRYSWAFVLTIFFVGFSWAQTDRYMVFFKDKLNTPYSVDEPAQYLSERAIERRLRQGIAITESDLPVSIDYVSQLTALGVDVYFKTKWMNGVLVQTSAAKIAEVEGLPFVSSTELVGPGAVLTQTRTLPVASAFREVNDSGTLNTNLQLSMLGIDEMHAENFRGEGIVIAVMDGGFLGVNTSEVFEPIFADNRIVGARDFVQNSYDPYQYSTHGTAVLSCIGGLFNETLKSGAPEASFILLVTEEVATEYRIEEYNWLFGAEYADSLGADIINTSLGYTEFDLTAMNYTYDDLDGQTTIVTRASEMAFDKGMLLVTSAGNSGNSRWQFISAPADGENVLAVGALTPSLTKASFSSIGPSADERVKPDVVALGQEVVVFSSDQYHLSSGTSFSAPLVSGLAAGLWQANPDWTNRELLEALRQSGSNFGNPSDTWGYGIPNFRLEGAEIVLSSADEITDIQAYPNPIGNGNLTLAIPGTERFQQLRIYDLKGNHLHSQPIAQQGDQEIEMKDLPNGLYILTLEGNERSRVIKIIKN